MLGLFFLSSISLCEETASYSEIEKHTRQKQDNHYHQYLFHRNAIPLKKGTWSWSNKNVVISTLDVGLTDRMSLSLSAGYLLIFIPIGMGLQYTLISTDWFHWDIGMHLGANFGLQNPLIPVSTLTFGNSTSNVSMKFFSGMDLPAFSYSIAGYRRISNSVSIIGEYNRNQNLLLDSQLMFAIVGFRFLLAQKFSCDVGMALIHPEDNDQMYYPWVGLNVPLFPSD